MTLLLTLGGCARPAGPAAATPEGRPAVEVIAHRGASGAAPENTMAAFRRAAELGADRVELDVQLSRDGRLVVFHDATLGRTAPGTGPVSAHDASTLARLDAGSWFSPRFAGEPVPLLEEVLDWSAGRMPLNVEIKVAGDDAHALRLARETATLVEARGLAAETVLSSFHSVAVAEAARTCPSCEVALLWGGRDGDPLALAERAGARALHVALRGLSAELVAEAHGRGWPVRVYTINDREGLERVLESGADALFTDHPERALDWLGREPAPR